MFKIKYILLPALILSCNMDKGFTQEQETRIKEIVVTEQNESLKSLIEAAGNNTSNESLLDIIIKGKNKIVSGAHKTGRFFKGLKGAIMPTKPASPAPATPTP
ncbi:hypothetical protein [Borreliella valaisiana]|uniref:Uncharacterized protein n=1 Tax=Borreliella valaisiana VS116 TaxID=445987 RepID=C0R864_BORVA|nr:hypothetical protein [Borreliella valaisiana]AIJ30256.1 hypothetical protein P613_04750 [Borreliella valaisiana Tom4006]ACN52669.1 conserved hypothetical protein [Borreliella valaisiana VS116]WKC76630.1 hypothetical protein QIA32_00320 [Borreliella valaisiana]WLN25680.1 hypothetical protein KJD10_04435 [Borreliella valaisiana]WVN14645.1 hypothetical protein KJD09_04785 [Borreliella valaisiana]